MFKTQKFFGNCTLEAFDDIFTGSKEKIMEDPAYKKMDIKFTTLKQDESGMITEAYQRMKMTMMSERDFPWRMVKER